MLAQSKTDVNLMYTNFAEMSGMTLDELLESFGMDEDGVSEIAEDSVIDVMIASLEDGRVVRRGTYRPSELVEAQKMVKAKFGSRAWLHRID